MDLKPSTEGQRELGPLGVEVRGMSGRRPQWRGESKKEKSVWIRQLLRGQETPGKT